MTVSRFYHTAMLLPDGKVLITGGNTPCIIAPSLVSGRTVITPQVIFGGRPAKVLYYEAAPGYPGYYQVNFVVPHGRRRDLLSPSG